MTHDAGDRHSVQTARAVLNEMETRGVEPTPQNFFLWSAYIAGDNADLVNDMRAFADGGQTFDAEASRLLFDRYHGEFAGDDTTAEATARMEAAFGQVMASLADHTENTKAYGDALAGASGELDGDLDAEDLRKMVKRLASATEDMRRHTDQLESDLADTRREVAQLRTKLEKVREEALTDALTGLANRKRFDDTLRAEHRASERDGRPLSLLMADIDHFKRFNDTWGHQTGDQIIRFVATCISRNVDDVHLVSRYGGEEFAVIMPTTGLAAAEAIADRIRATVESKKLMRRSTNECLGNATISLGVAQLRPGEEMWQFVERADQALYASKRDGRNRVTIAAPGDEQRSAA